MNINLLAEKVGISKKYFWGILAFALFNILFSVFVFGSHLYPFISDSYEHVKAARYLMGDTSARIFPQRMLKPLMPLLVGIASPVFGYQSAFVAINIVFYLLIGFFVFKIVYELFADEFQAFVASAFFLSAYPILKYGMSYLSDLSGWLFFCAAVYYVLKFLRAPSYKMAMIIGFVSAAGFLFKESGGMGLLFFFLCVVFGLDCATSEMSVLEPSRKPDGAREANFQQKISPRVEKQIFRWSHWLQKLKFLSVCGLAFAVPFLIWQIFAYTKFHYSYYDWYFLNRVDATAFTKKTIWLATLKSSVVLFLAGWIFAILGFWKIFKSTSLPAQTKKIILALIPPSLTFLLWPAVSSRLFYIIGLILSLGASYFFASLKIRSRFAGAALFAIIVLPNYLWFIFDDNFRAVINGILKLSY